MSELGGNIFAAYLGAVVALAIVAMCAITADFAHETLTTCQQVLQ